MDTASKLRPAPRSTAWRRLKRIALALLLVLVIAAAISAISNYLLPTASRIPTRLSDEEKSLLAESQQLKHSIGQALWPGWGETSIPTLVYNEEYGFLIGEAHPPDGWEKVQDDDFLNQPYYRIAHPKRSAFAVQLGTHWAGSMPSKEWMQISSVRNLRRELPAGLKTVFPYRVFVRMMNLHSSDQHIVYVLHENFHAYQAQTAPNRFAEAMAAYKTEDQYPWDDDALRVAWRAEINLLVQGLNASSDKEAARLARQFLAQRRQRRRRLTAAQVSYEQHMEWLEGLAKYIEVGLWRQASLSKDYQPLPQLAADPEFKRYSGFPRRWSGELMSMRLQASKRGDVRFYYTGMAQGMLLDRLLPSWKSRVMQEDVTLDALLEEAVGRP